MLTMSTLCATLRHFFQEIVPIRQHNVQLLIVIRYIEWGVGFFTLFRLFH